MSGDLQLGELPDGLTVGLATTADYFQTVRLAGDDGTPFIPPADFTVTLEFSTSPKTVWIAAFSGADAVFDIPPAVADLIPPGTAVALVFTWAGPRRQIPNRGRVSRG